MSVELGALTLRLVHPTAPVLLTKNDPLGTLIRDTCGFIIQESQRSHPFKRSPGVVVVVVVDVHRFAALWWLRLRGHGARGRESDWVSWSAVDFGGCVTWTPRCIRLTAVVCVVPWVVRWSGKSGRGDSAAGTAQDAGGEVYRFIRMSQVASSSLGGLVKRVGSRPIGCSVHGSKVKDTLLSGSTAAPFDGRNGPGDRGVDAGRGMRLGWRRIGRVVVVVVVDVHRFAALWWLRLRAAVLVGVSQSKSDWVSWSAVDFGGYVTWTPRCIRLTAVVCVVPWVVRWSGKSGRGDSAAGTAQDAGGEVYHLIRMSQVASSSLGGLVKPNRRSTPKTADNYRAKELDLPAPGSAALPRAGPTPFRLPVRSVGAILMCAGAG
ncbi:hypothetical protein EAG_14933 [Camponotus floridanus]|uniref:Uncharacterized protein n=1 Tax=Camponotus floridanus TaxID=104421 RepID=E2AIL4_CAMFO|nr:hypothetical protein EAG_14933 [Camponotus floridanus]